MLNEDSLLFAWLGNGVIGMAYVQMTYFSPALAKTTRMNLILPEDRPGPWKVLWLLHGWSEDCTAWQRFSSVERYVQPYGLAVVMPDAHLSFYHDMEHGPAYYTHIAKELPELVARMFPVSQKPGGYLYCRAFHGRLWRTSGGDEPAGAVCRRRLLFGRQFCRGYRRTRLASSP